MRSANLFGPLKGLCPHKALIGLTQASGLAGGFDSAFFESTSRPRSQSGKVRRSDTRPGDVRERAERSESSDTTPIRNAPCFAVCALVCDPVGEGECVPAFARESKRGPFVGEVEKCDEERFETALWRQLFGAICGNDFGRKIELFKLNFWIEKAVRF